MKRLLLLVAALLAPFDVALALGHETLACLECHARLGRPDPSWDERDWRELGLCIGCHDGGTLAPDVVRGAREMVSSGLVAAGEGRSGGGLNLPGDRGGAAAGGYHEYFGHTLGSTQPPPGFAGSWPQGARLVCKSCHAIHSNGNFRNLGPDPYLRDPEYVASFGRLFGDDAQPSFAVVPDAAALAGATTDVLLVQRPGEDAGSFGASRVLYVVHPPRYAMNAFCATCHPAFHGDANTRDGDDYVKHPTSGVALGAAMREELAGAGQPLRVSYRTDGTPEVACLTCHRAHGTRRPFGLVYWEGESAANGEDGAGAGLETLCSSCHRFDR